MTPYEEWYASLTWRGRAHCKARRWANRWDDWLYKGPDWVFNLFSLYDRQYFTPFCWALGHFPVQVDYRATYCATCGKGLG